MRGKADGTGGVVFVNALLGWTLIGWLVSFIWACSGTRRGLAVDRPEPDAPSREDQHPQP